MADQGRARQDQEVGKRKQGSAEEVCIYLFAMSLILRRVDSRKDQPQQSRRTRMMQRRQRATGLQRLRNEGTVSGAGNERTAKILNTEFTTPRARGTRGKVAGEEGEGEGKRNDGRRVK
jgi:hypothetical protein